MPDPKEFFIVDTDWDKVKLKYKHYTYHGVNQICYEYEYIPFRWYIKVGPEEFVPPWPYQRYCYSQYIPTLEYENGYTELYSFWGYDWGTMNYCTGKKVDAFYTGKRDYFRPRYVSGFKKILTVVFSSPMRD